LHIVNNAWLLIMTRFVSQDTLARTNNLFILQFIYFTILNYKLLYMYIKIYRNIMNSY